MRLRRVLAPLALAGMLGSGAVALAPAAPAAAADTCEPGSTAQIPGPAPAFAQLGLDVNRESATGAGITVAIVDSGVDATRPQLASALGTGSVSLIDDGARTDGLSDVHGHGTAIAGVIAARPSDVSGVVGIAPDARIISIRVFQGDTERQREDGLGPSTARTAAGIRAAADAGAQVIAVALSEDVDSPALRDATAYAFAQGSLVVASAGNAATTENTAPTPRYPAAYPGALAVTAVDAENLPTDDSIHGAHIDVAAPGQYVLTTAVAAGDCVYAADAPAASFATAYAAGAAALVAEAFPEEGPAGWAYRLKATAERADPDAPDELTGWGLLRPLDAIALRPSSSTRGPASPFADNSEAALVPPVVQVEAAEPPAEGTALVIAVSAAALAMLATLLVITRLRQVRREQRG